MTELETSRRNLLGGLAAAGVALPVLAACGSSSGDATGSTAPDPSASSGGSTGSTPPGGASSGGIKTSEIPVGGGRIFTAQKVVVTQPTAGQFKAFSAICTHQGCMVEKVSGGTIDCPCHGSTFSITDGSVKGGPAPRALPEKTVTVSSAGDTLTVS